MLVELRSSWRDLEWLGRRRGRRFIVFCFAMAWFAARSSNIDAITSGGSVRHQCICGSWTSLAGCSSKRSEYKMLTRIDDHSRFFVVAAVPAVPSGRAVAEAFLKAMRICGVPAEVLTDNGKQIHRTLHQTPSGRGAFRAGLPRERHHGAADQTVLAGKIERWHQTLRGEVLDPSEPFADLPTAQAAISAPVHNHSRPHQALDMATPATCSAPTRNPSHLWSAATWIRYHTKRYSPSMGTVAIEAIRAALEQSWSVDTSAASGWTEANRAKGQCAVTACVVQDYLGGEILNTTATLPSGETVSHYFNLVDGGIVDLTRPQFPDTTRFSKPKPKKKGFASTREYCLSYESTRQRYALLNRRVARYLHVKG
ncbi:integrase core domain-containing protein [Nocardia vinacea]|uniref:YunG family protein n=1 Tax=Nocardia vinacea TaxID=96468 RepID=UPI0033FC2832